VLVISRKIATTAIVATCMLVALTPGDAAADTGPRVSSADQAGFSATGARFYGVEIWAKLPDAGRFSGQLGRVGVSVQLWTRQMVFDLTVSACTDPACIAGGKPASYRYRPVLSIYNRSTHAVVCSTSPAKGLSTCSGEQPGWNQCRISPQQTVNLSMDYFHPAGWLNALVQAGRCSVNVIDSPGVGLVVNQARIVAQFGLTPWSPVRIRAPRSTERLVTLGTPTPPPYYAEIGIYTRQFYGACIGTRWTHHPVSVLSASSRSPLAAPTAFWANGCDFGIDLERR